MQTIRKIVTVYEARQANKLKDSCACLETDYSSILVNFPQIGMLIRKGKPVYYVTSPEYLESVNPGDLI